MKINMKKFFYYSLALFSLTIILFNSATQLFQNRNLILKKLGLVEEKIVDMEHMEKRFLVNPLQASKRQVPPIDMKDLIFENTDEDEVGLWSAPIDWNVTALHSILLPDGTVMTYGSYGVEKKEENKDIRENKKLTLTDGFELERDKGDYQWHAHDVQGAVDFDIWDPSKGVGDDSHILFKRPVVYDAFCSIVRVLDLEKVFILGGNREPKKKAPNTQKASTFYNVKTKKFSQGKQLKYDRWYGSLVRTSEDEFVMIGGRSTHEGYYSVIPEIFKKTEYGGYEWKELPKAKSLNLFGNGDSGTAVDSPHASPNEEWFYPKSYLASDGNIVGISYNKIWVMDKNNEYQISKTSEIPLVTGGISKLQQHQDLNDEKKESLKLQVLTLGAGVGHKSSTIMIDKDIVFSVGGKQTGDEYASSNKAYAIDFADTKKPIIKNLKGMSFPRSNANATMLPNGEIFVNGGSAYKDLEFSVFTAEIYNIQKDEWREISKGTFRRNYHATSLLLPNGTILVAGGDVYNAEIFYPPYLFQKKADGKTVLAKRPEINKIDKTIEKRSNVTIDIDNTENIEQITIISTGSTTHAQGSEQKFRSLDFKKIDKNSISFDIPENKNEIQNGIYMIFAVDSYGVPSEGKIVYLK